MASESKYLFNLTVLALLLGSALLNSALAGKLQGKPLVQAVTVVAGEGLGQNWAVQQGPDGLIYVGGGSNLLVDDGAGWRSIATPDEGRVRDLQIDEQGRIWVASPGEFGYFMRAAKGQLDYHSISEKLPENLRDFGETRYVRLLGEAVYFNTLDRLFRWADGQLTSFGKWDGVFRLAFVADDRYFVAVKDRIYDFTDFPADGSPPEPEDRWRWPDGTKITFLSDWKNQQLLLGTYDEGLYLLGDDQAVQFNNDPVMLQAWPYKALKLASGSLAIATIKDGLLHLDSDGQLLEQISSANGLPANSILAMTEDSEGGLWLAQEGAVSRVELNLSLRYFDKDANISQVRGLVEYNGHTVVAGSPTLGVLENSNGIARMRTLDVPMAQEAFDLLATDHGIFVSGFNGVHLLDFDEGMNSVTSSDNLYQDTYSYDLFPSGTRPVIYIESESGVAALVYQQGQWRATARVAGINERPATYAEDTEGRVWAGSGNGKIYQLRWRDNETLVLQNTLSAEQGVPAGNAHVYRLGDRLIFGTTKGGYRLTEDGQRIEPDPQFGNEQLPDGQRDIFRFYSRDQANIVALVGSNKAIWRGQLNAAGKIQWFGPLWQQLDPGNATFLNQANDSLWVGQATRLLRFSWPQARTPEHPAVPLNLRWVGFPDRADDEHKVLMQGNFSDQLQAPQALPQSQDALRFEFALASYTRPDKTRYRVWLDGHEDGWSRWSSETRRDYTNLKGGDYQFRVQAKNLLDVVSESLPYRFSVQPPWYLSRTALFLWVCLALLLMCLSAWLGLRWRQKRLLMTQKQLEQEVAERTTQVRKQAQELRELSDAKSRFFANVSHEFRTPLTLLKGPLKELENGATGKLDDDAKRYVSMALRNAETLQSLIAQILDANRLEAGQMPVSITHDDLIPLVNAQIAAFKPQASRHDVTIEFEHDDQAVMADFDPGHMATIVRNLLSNACKFTTAGGSIHIHCSAQEGNVVLTVRDTGCGIEPDDLPHVFERYYQGDQSHASQPGTGIGLALVRELVELHQGSVQVESTLHEGSTFTVNFPQELTHLRQTVTVSDATDEEITTQLIESDEEDTPTVLIVDDNTELRAFLNFRLRGSYHILEAGDGQQGLEIARTQLPDIVVSDVMMPKMTGLEMVAALRTDPETDFIPVLLLSARTTRRDTVAGLELGADDYLSKPFDSAELATRIAGLIASRRKLRKRFEQSGVQPARSAFLEKAEGILQEQLAEADFGARDWADLMHMDRTTLYRKLKAKTDLSPEEYLREKRLEKAAELLTQGAGNVSQVAVNVGFNSISYFSKRFKQRFGMTPAAWARK